MLKCAILMPKKVAATLLLLLVRVEEEKKYGFLALLLRI